MHKQIVKFVLLCAGVALASGCSSTGEDNNTSAAANTSTEASPSAQDEADTLPDGVLPLPQPSDGEDFAVLPAGRYQVPISDTLAYEIELPEGTYAYDGKYLAFDQARPQQIAGILYVDEAGDGTGVSRDPCTKQEEIVPAGKTVGELVTAITNQPILEVSEPVPTTLGKARGLSLRYGSPRTTTPLPAGTASLDWSANRGWFATRSLVTSARGGSSTSTGKDPGPAVLPRTMPRQLDRAP